LCFIALLNKSVAALLYTLVAVPLILFFTPKTQFRVAVFLAITVLLYPALRGADLVPVEDIQETMAAQFGPERARSLETRFTNEDALLERARERSFFGWGTYGRSTIYDLYSGEQSSISDGDWIITIGTFGFLGFLAKYLLLLLPIFVTSRQIRYLPRLSDRRLLSALALMVGFSAFDLLPNGNFNYLPFVFSGALVGCSTGMLQHASWRQRMKQQQAEARRFDVEGQSAPA
jgi:O-antigen ligase